MRSRFAFSKHRPSEYDCSHEIELLERALLFAFAFASFRILCFANLKRNWCSQLVRNYSLTLWPVMQLNDIVAVALNAGVFLYFWKTSQLSRQDLEQTNAKLRETLLSHNDEPLRILLVGRQGAGKSSLINSLIFALSGPESRGLLSPARVAPPESYERVTKGLNVYRIPKQNSKIFL
jgi:hypothetical protein